MYLFPKYGRYSTTDECLDRFCIRKLAGHSGLEEKNVHVVLIASNSYTPFLPHLLNQTNKFLKCFIESFQGVETEGGKMVLSEFYALNFTGT